MRDPQKATPGGSGQAVAEQQRQRPNHAAAAGNMQVIDIAPADNLVTLPERINSAVQAAESHARSAVECAIRAGGLLLQAKALVQYGEWEGWLQQHVTCAPRTAQAYMRLHAKVKTLPKPEAQRVALLPLRDAMKAIATEPRDASAKASKPRTKVKPIRIGAIEVPPERLQTLVNEFDRPEAFTPERTAHAVKLLRDLLTTGDAKTASIEQVVAMRHPPAATLPPAAPPDPRDDPDVAEEDQTLEARMVTPVDFEALQVIRWIGSLELGRLTDPALILTEMQSLLDILKRDARFYRARPGLTTRGKKA
jgi:hypothetical protein